MIREIRMRGDLLSTDKSKYHAISGRCRGVAQLVSSGRLPPCQVRIGAGERSSMSSSVPRSSTLAGRRSLVGLRAIAIADSVSPLAVCRLGQAVAADKTGWGERPMTSWAVVAVQGVRGLCCGATYAHNSLARRANHKPRLGFLCLARHAPYVHDQYRPDHRVFAAGGAR